MSGAHALYHMARADFLERTRRYGFLVTLGGALFLAYQVIAGNAGMDLGHHRGLYNSAWVGMMMAMTTAAFVSLAGFYVVKNTIERDRHTRVGQILAATPVTRAGYLLAKLASNFAVLAVIVGILGAAAILAQLWRGEDRRLDLWLLAGPFLVITLPLMAWVAALAVLFETMRWLRGGLGNVVYVFVWALSLVVPVETGARWADLLLLREVQESLTTAVQAAVPTYSGGFSIGAGPRGRIEERASFVWRGLRWRSGVLAQRAGLVGAAVALALAGSLFFDRFDPARRAVERRARGPSARRRAHRDRRAAEPDEEESEESEESAPASPAGATHLSPLVPARARSTFRAALMAEVKLLLKGLPWWWHAGAAGALVAQLAAPMAAARSVALGIAWLWPVLAWSALGARETREGTDQILHSCAHPLARQLPATWAAGVLLALATGSGIAVRLLLAGDAPGLGAWAAGALFIPTLALTCGIWSGSSRLFEALYTLLWYVGPMNRLPALDLWGASPASASAGTPLFILAWTGALLAAALVGRRRRLRSGEPLLDGLRRPLRRS